MPTTSKKILHEALRAKYTEALTKLLTDEGEEVLRVGSNVLAFPCVDDEGNDEYIELTIKVPTGGRDGEIYDGYALRDDYKLHCEQKAEAAKIAAEKKAKKSPATKPSAKPRQKPKPSAKRKKRRKRGSNTPFLRVRRMTSNPFSNFLTSKIFQSIHFLPVGCPLSSTYDQLDVLTRRTALPWPATDKYMAAATARFR